MRDITQKIAKAKDFLVRGSEDYAILSIIEVLEILAAPEPETTELDQSEKVFAAFEQERSLKFEALRKLANMSCELGKAIGRAEKAEKELRTALDIAWAYQKERDDLREICAAKDEAIAELRELFTDTLSEKWGWIKITAKSVRRNFAVEEWANRVIVALGLDSSE